MPWWSPPDQLNARVRFTMNGKVAKFPRPWRVPCSPVLRHRCHKPPAGMHYACGAEFFSQLCRPEVALMNPVPGTIEQHALMHLFTLHFVPPCRVDDQNSLRHSLPLCQKTRAQGLVEMSVEMGCQQVFERVRAKG